MFQNQFLLTKSSDFKEKWSRLNWKKENIESGGFTLFCHPNINLIKNSIGNPKLYVIGSLYDWEFPELTDQEIIDQLSECSATTIFDRASKYCGDFIIIFSSDNSLIMFNDASGLREIYYDLSFSNFASQISLLAQGIELVPHEDQEPTEFYNSEVFNDRRLFIGDSTHVKNVKHLNCNHSIDLIRGEVKRFYPNKKLHERSLNEAAQVATKMIKGYLKAISNRHDKIALAVTGGYDSRILFLASLDLPEEQITYYVVKHINVPDTHYDVSLPSKLTSIYGRKLHILDKSKIPKIKDISDLNDSLDFPPREVLEDIFKGQVYINGNVYEIARGVFGFDENLTVKDLMYIFGYGKLKFPALIYKEWLKNKSKFNDLGYNFLDFLYWEERLGIWLSKGNTEQLSLNKSVKSPYNSRHLIEILLSVNKKYRNLHYNVLQNKIIKIMSGNNSEITSIPVNPTRKRMLYITLFKMNLHDIFRNIGLKLRLFGGLKS